MSSTVAAGRRPRPGRALRLDGWSVLTIVVALAVAAPLAGLPLSYIGGTEDALGGFADLVPEAALTTALLIAGVGVGTLVLGTALAALISFFDFPGRSWIEWALVLPLAMPGYVFTLFALGTFGSTLPVLRSTGGALALMEALADFGTVNLLGVRSFTDAIYRVWFTAFDREAAMQLAALLLSVTLALLVIERLARGRARYHQLSARGEAVEPVRLHGAGAAAAALVPNLLVVGVVLVPLGQLAGWAAESISDGLLPVEFGTAARNSLLLAGASALLVTAIAVLLAYGFCAARPPPRRAARPLP